MTPPHNRHLRKWMLLRMAFSEGGYPASTVCMTDCRMPKAIGNLFKVGSIKTKGLQNAQCSHRLEKYLNLEGYLEKPLKIKYALKSTGKSLKCLKKSLNSSIFCWTKHC